MVDLFLTKIISDNDWWIVGIVLVGVFAAVALIAAGTVLVYQKKGDAIRRAFAAKVRMVLTGKRHPLI